ncbi:MAG: dihydrodipicolinate synthase family protein [Clostridia bacterium]|nr:dihydrodipicolinate synthase family protein [Clostridia bacterium]
MEKFFTGIYSAIFSVYDQNMDVIKETVHKLVDYQLNAGLKGFYVGGNTGECTVLPAKTRKQMLETVIEANDGRGKIMAHIGAGHFDEVMDLLSHANEQKIDAIASLPPALCSYYGHDETIKYYKKLAKESRFPVYAYVTPVTMQHSDLYTFAKELSEVDNIAGLKITIPDYYRFARVNQIAGGRLNTLNGPDEMMLSSLVIGADGAIGTTYNIVPKVAVKIYDSFQKGDLKTALEYQNKLNEFISVMRPGNIAYWKAPMTLLGFNMGYTVFPRNAVTEEEMEDLKKKLTELKFFDEMV